MTENNLHCTGMVLSPSMNIGLTIFQSVSRVPSSSTSVRQIAFYNMEEERQSAFNILVIWRGKKLNLEMEPGRTLKEFGHKLQKLTNVKADTMRLLVPRSMDEDSKMLTPFSEEHSSLSLQEASILEGKTIRMMGVFEEEIEEVKQNTKADLRITGFDEEERRSRQRILGMPQTSLKLPQGNYIFCDFRTLQIPGIKLNPPDSEALRRMHMLAADPGIIAIMNKHRWRVGIMTEMAPVGYVGISPKCLLGYNKNHGEEISLRIRTDDLKGFRKYESIKKTLLHELAHMVFSEHDANFFALNKQLNEEAASLDWTRSRSHTLSGVRPSEYYEEEFYVGSSGNTSQRLGGKTPDQLASARASSVAAAYSRLANASTNRSGEFGEHVESHPDDFELIAHEPFPDDLAVKESMQVDKPKEAGCNSNFEPDPDDCEGGKVIKSESFLGTSTNRFTYEPDQDDCEVIRYMPNLGTDRKMVGSNTCEEPDPDDSEVNGIASKCGVTVQLGMDDAEGNGILDNAIQHKNSFEEPDPDDSGASLEHRSGSEPDPDDSQGNVIMQFEPDPDDSQGNGILQFEPDPDDSGASLERRRRSEPDPDDSQGNVIMQFEPDPDDSQGNGILQFEPDPDDSGASLEHRSRSEPDPDDSQGNGFMQFEPDPDDSGTSLEHRSRSEPDPDDSQGNGIMQVEPDPDDNMENSMGSSRMQVVEPNPDDGELQRIQDPVSAVCARLQRAIEVLRSEVKPTEVTSVLQTLFKIIRNVIEHPDEMKFRSLRKANPLFQRNVANYKAAMEVLLLVGFKEDVVSDEVGRGETFVVLKRNDPGLLWLAKSSLEMCIVC
ncbi:hypothetical protein NE237_001696 [Protea cynaroides]|uniref:WLM domain-containing protein n=1 Tax=Protea cynaroides TaxID=273540 RepID=A0A9Q0QYQ0_9MAGN|nr:hypothetical protein NE237_001696 [Protea cynaroides]